MIRTSTSPPAVSAVFVDEAGRRRRCMVVLGRAALAVLVVATAAMVTALLTGARLPLLGLPDGVAAPAERAIRALSDLPRPAAEQQPAGRRPQPGGPLPVTEPLPSTAGSPERVVGPVDASGVGPTTDGSSPAGNGEAPTGPDARRPVTAPAPEPVRPGRPAPSGQAPAPAKTPARTPAKAQGKGSTKTPAKPATTAKGPTPAKPSRPAASPKPRRSAPHQSPAARPAGRPTDAGRSARTPARHAASRSRPTTSKAAGSPGATRRTGPPEAAGTRPATVRGTTGAGQDQARRPARARSWAEHG